MKSKHYIILALIIFFLIIGIIVYKKENRNYIKISEDMVEDLYLLIDTKYITLYANNKDHYLYIDDKFDNKDELVLLLDMDGKPIMFGGSNAE